MYDGMFLVVCVCDDVLCVMVRVRWCVCVCVCLCISFYRCIFHTIPPFAFLSGVYD